MGGWVDEGVGGWVGGLKGGTYGCGEGAFAEEEEFGLLALEVLVVGHFGGAVHLIRVGVGGWVGERSLSLSPLSSPFSTHPPTHPPSLLSSPSIHPPTTVP